EGTIGFERNTCGAATRKSASHFLVMLLEPSHHLRRGPDLNGFARRRRGRTLHTAQQFERNTVTRALATMAGTGAATLAHQLDQRIANTLAGDLDQPELRHRRDLRRCVILGKTLRQLIQHLFDVRRVAQMNEVDDDEPANSAQSYLPSDLFGR